MWEIMNGMEKVFLKEEYPNINFVYALFRSTKDVIILTLLNSYFVFGWSISTMLRN